MSRLTIQKSVRVHTGDQNLDDIQSARDEFARYERAKPIPIRDAVLIAGTPDASQPGGITDGISLAMGSAVELFHGLGRRAQGFIVADVRDNPVVLERDDAGLTAGLELTHIRVYFDPLSHNHGGPAANAMQGTARFKLLVF